MQQQGVAPPQYGAQQTPAVQIVQVEKGGGQARPNTTTYLVMSIVACCFCGNLFCGVPALILAVSSSNAADAGDMEAARSKGRTSLILSITGIVFSLLIIVVIIALYFVLWKTTADAIDDAIDDAMNWWQ